MLAEEPARWIAEGAAAIAARAERDLAALVAVSSPSGDVAAAEEAVAVAAALLPAEAEISRPECSTAANAPDLLARISGTGRGRLLLLGHLDTVVPHADFRPLEADGERLYGSGAIDMKGGNVIALGLMRALTGDRAAFEEVSILLVNDEEWRSTPFVHGAAFAGYDACFCFEAGERLPGGEEGVVVGRKAAYGLGVRARGRAAHSGANFDEGLNALAALAALAGTLSALHDPAGEHGLTVVPTVIRAGDAINVVPAEGELRLDLRATDEAAFEQVLAAVPAYLDGVELEAVELRRWPGMDMRAAATGLLANAGELLGRPLRPTERGGASDASHLAAHVPISIDGLGPLGAGAHSPDEHLIRDSLHDRAEVALALAAALLLDDSRQPDPGPGSLSS